ncbi:MAG TPA: hypothetical protein VNI34_05955 [Candidatus Nitrosotalea sp.]|nr:hypothetical protein [Candidatus Nitrosotalea sp.]
MGQLRGEDNTVPSGRRGDSGGVRRLRVLSASVESGSQAAGEAARVAAEKIGDAERIFPDEDPQSQHLDDAEHWFNVYTELLQAKASLLAALSERLPEMNEAVARHEVGDTDAVLLRQELARFQARIDFWRRRRAELLAKLAEAERED